MASQKRILIAGAGVAGPSLALFLSRIGHKCTIVERATEIRASGQQIDVSGEGLKVIQLLGIKEELLARTVRDDGIKFVEDDNKVVAAFPVEAIDGERSVVKEVEIMRFDLSLILYERTKDDVEYIFNEQISALSQDETGVTVKFAGSPEDRKFDIVVAADGLRSRTRDLAFAPSNTEIVSMKQYATFFSIPWEESDGTWTRAYNATNGRTVCLRPNKNASLTGAYLCQVTEDSGKFANMGFEEQKQEVSRVFKDAGWETERILKEMEGPSGERFYVQENAQVKAASLVSGRVVLLGDAGYCPAPVTGQGTTLAFIGAYVLAGCIATYSDKEALSQYDIEMRPFIKNSQKLPPGVPWIVSPQSSTGIAVLKNALWLAGLVVNSGLASAFSKAGEWIPTMNSSGLTLPEYEALKLNM